MSETTSTQPEMNYGRIGSLGFILGLIGLLACLAVMYGGDKAMATNMMHSWMFGWAFWLALTLGCLGFTLLHHVVRGSWGQAVIRIFEAGGGVFALGTIAVLFAPIYLHLDKFYGMWVHPEPGDKIVAAKAVYMTPVAFLGRFIVFFAIWMAFAAVLRRSILRQDKTGDLNQQHFRTNLSAPGLVLYVITLTLATTDWFMSMDAHWMSTMFGPLYMIVCANLAIGFAAAVVCFNSNKAPYNAIMSKDLTRDFGNVTFMFVMLWVYFMLSQFIIIWHGNLPEYTSYYYKRQYESGFLLALGAINIVFGWFVPWMTLLSPKIKTLPKAVGQVAVFIFLMRIIDVYWNIMPFLRGGYVYPMWTDLVAFITIGGWWLFAFGKTASQASILPEHDTRLQEAIAHVA